MDESVKTVTVLYAEIAGIAAMSTELPPAVFKGMIHQFANKIEQCVRKIFVDSSDARHHRLTARILSLEAGTCTIAIHTIASGRRNISDDEHEQASIVASVTLAREIQLAMLESDWQTLHMDYWYRSRGFITRDEILHLPLIRTEAYAAVWNGPRVRIGVATGRLDEGFRVHRSANVNKHASDSTASSCCCCPNEDDISSSCNSNYSNADNTANTLASSYSSSSRYPNDHYYYSYGPTDWIAYRLMQRAMGGQTLLCATTVAALPPAQFDTRPLPFLTAVGGGEKGNSLQGMQGFGGKAFIGVQPASHQSGWKGATSTRSGMDLLVAARDEDVYTLEAVPGRFASAASCNAAHPGETSTLLMSEEEIGCHERLPNPIVNADTPAEMERRRQDRRIARLFADTLRRYYKQVEPAAQRVRELRALAVAWEVDLPHHLTSEGAEDAAIGILDHRSRSRSRSPAAVYQHPMVNEENSAGVTRSSAQRHVTWMQQTTSFTDPALNHEEIRGARIKGSTNEPFDDDENASILTSPVFRRWVEDADELIVLISQKMAKEC